MSVEIALRVEILRKGVWEPVKKRILEDDEWKENLTIYTGSYRPFEAFLNESAYLDVPDDVSAQTLDDFCPKGYFNFDKLRDFCKEREDGLAASLEKSMEMETVMGIRRIERYILRGTKSDEELPELDITIQDCLEDFEFDNYSLLAFRNTVNVLAEGAKDIRVLYEIC